MFAMVSLFSHEI